MERKPIITFLGPSGIGKTTMAKWVSETYDIPFVTGSYSDLVPSTRKLSHREMMGLDTHTQFKQDLELIKARIDSYKAHRNGMVSDRSLIDVFAYALLKYSNKVPACDIDTIQDWVSMNLYLVDLVIFMPYSIGDEWSFEDNGKRVVNPYFQAMVSTIMDMVLVEVNAITTINFKVLTVGSLEYRREALGYILDNFLEKWQK